MKVSSIFSNGMIFQRDKELVIYGAAAAGTVITAELAGKKSEGTADENGTFTVTFPPFAAGGPYTLSMSASDGDAAEYTDLWAGDVFLISGQSNMELPVKRTLDLYRAEVTGVNYPQIRMFQLPKVECFEGPRDFLTEGEWIAVTPESVMEFSAVGFYFAEMKQQEDGVPVGLVHAAIGGAHVEAFISEETLVKEAIKMRAAAVRRGDFRKCMCDNNGSCKWCYEEQIARDKDPEYVRSVQEAEAARAEAWFATRDRHDMGLAGAWEQSEWDEKVLHEADVIHVPGMWNDHIFGKMCGVIWLQRTVEVPAHFCNQSVELRLGTLVDSDMTYINGVLVGRTEYRYPPRRYALDKNVLKPGRNVITIRLTMDANIGGFKTDMPYCLKLGEEEISLEGKWYARIGTVEEPLAGGTFFAWKPTALYNSMIYPVRYNRFAGILFYQGESNCELAEDYVFLHRAMIEEWRSVLGEELPYVYAQLPDFEGEGGGGCDAWIRMQRAQTKALELPKTRMAVLHDLGQYNELHPQNKKEVAKRFYEQWRTFD